MKSINHTKPPSYDFAREQAKSADLWLRRLIYAYFWLLIFEGALRKWFLPGLSAPLLVARDPIAIAMIYLVFKRGWFANGGYRLVILVMAVVFAVLGTLQLFAFFRLPFVVVAFGWRTYMLHLPVIFIVAEVLQPADLRRLGGWCCKLAVPMVILCYLQYYGKADSFVNAGASRGAVQIAFEGDRVRASGTFSFTTGTATYFALTAAFAVWNFSRSNATRLERLTNYLVLLSVIAFIPVSGGRLALYMIEMVLVCGAAMILIQGRLLLLPVVAVGVIGLSLTPFFRDSTESLEARLTSARMFEDEEYADGFFGTRVADGFVYPIIADERTSIFLGHGLGLGTQVGSALVGDTGDFLLGEGEWGRIIGECGYVTGVLYIGFRVWFTIDLLLGSLAAVRAGFWLPLLLWFANVWTALQGQLGQPTNLGFFVINSSAILIALKAVQPQRPTNCRQRRQWAPGVARPSGRPW